MSPQSKDAWPHSGRGSVIEQEFLAAQKRPEQVLDRGAAIGLFGSFNGLDELFLFGGGWVAGEAGKIGHIHQFRGRGVGGEERGEDMVLRGKFRVQRVAVGD